MYSGEPLSPFVENYLNYLYETQPTAAAFDGVHQYDDLLEDPSRTALEGQGRELGGLVRQLAAVGKSGMTKTEQVEREMLTANIRARIFELENIRSWERNPQWHSEILATSLAGQVLFPYAPVGERARRILSKLKQTPRLVETARKTIQDPPGIFIKEGITSLNGVVEFIEHDLPRALTSLDDMHLLSDLADASTEAVTAIHGYTEYLRNEVAPKARGSFRLGRENFDGKLELEEGVTLGADRLLAIAQRELRETQEEFRSVAGRLGGDVASALERLKQDHPSAATLVSTAQGQVTELAAFVERKGLVSVTDGEVPVVAPTPPFYRWTFASLWAPGPFEARPLPTYYYLTDVDPAWTPDRQEQHLRDFHIGALWAISMHETYPGHFLQHQHVCRIESKLRKSGLLASIGFIEGWAHYGEQVMIEAGFGGKDNHVKLGQLAEALIRLARLVVGIRLHVEDMSVEQGVRFFRDEAFMEEGSARREAERGTFDPGYVVYSLGKLMILKLRADYEAKHPSEFSLKTFHDRLLGNGNLPIWAHRRLMLGSNAGNALA
ncbi:MAG: hypothetical protein CL487_06740 [Acidobacteria bacterium]|nr:hypothetical protein [Acidobacteriota bacterium]|tara:strand:+ start:557 stop:2212 length:1656 start_codon:yes stop_codon:yes gene_type:complete